MVRAAASLALDKIKTNARAALAQDSIQTSPTVRNIGKHIPIKAATPPRDFTLNMKRVHEIASETREVAAILSVLMADQPEKSTESPGTNTLPAPDNEIIPSANKDAAQLTRFAGLDIAFHSLLERLLTRDSWTQTDFNSIAREFNVMPGKIFAILNEWSDEALGEFILDGEDPIFIRRGLMAKEKTLYG
jgi:hypothetical protein